MAWNSISLTPIQYQNPADNTPANGFVLKAYDAGTTNNAVMSTDNTGGTTFTSIALNASGYPENLGVEVIPHIDRVYKLVMYATQADADADTGALRTFDDLTPGTATGSFTVNDAVSGGVTTVVSQTHTTSGTPTAGIGTGEDFIVETSGDNNEIIMQIQAVTTDVTSTSEDADLVVNLMAAGAAAAERFRVSSAGVVTLAGPINELTGAAVASAGTIDLDAATGNRVHVTGTTTITAVTLTKGPRTVIFDGILTLTHHATTNNLPSAANITTAAGDRAIYESDGTTVYCISYNRASGVPVISGPLVDDTTPQLGGALDTNSQQVQLSNGADVASATALPVLTDGNNLDVTGTTTITSINTTAVGNVITVQFDGALILTHHATDLILPGAANITTAAGDIGVFWEYATGDYRCIVFTKADGTPVIGGNPGDNVVIVHSGNGYGSTNTAIRRFTTTLEDTGAEITYADSAADGATFTVNADGLYNISYSDKYTGSGSYSSGISLNSSELTTSIGSITAADILEYYSQTQPAVVFVSTTVLLSSTDVIRAHSSAQNNDTGNTCRFTIRRVAST